jgi:DNA mismatch repair protein MutS
MTFRLDPAAPECSTPLMKQFLKLKEQAPEAVLFFRMGDFYELFGEDAVTAAPILGITLTSRDKKSENPVPMAGIPYHSSQAYLQKLLNAGKKVAIAEQILPEGMTPDQVKGIVERRIVRTFSPAVQFDLTGGQQPRFLATLSPSPAGAVLALLEPATGEIRVSSPLSERELLAEATLPAIRHFLNSSVKTPPDFLKLLETQGTLIEEVAGNLVSSTDALPLLQKQFERRVLPALLESEPACRSLAILVQYVLKSQGRDLLTHLHEPRSLHEKDRLALGPHTHAHLDTEDLLRNIERTATSMGARVLRSELEAPLKDADRIRERQQAVRELATSALESLHIHEELKNIYDLDRILGRIAAGLAHPRDTHAFGRSIASAFRFQEKIETFQSKALLEIAYALKEVRTVLLPLAERILRTQKPDAPLHNREGGIFEKGTDPELDRLLDLTTEGERFLIELEGREREATGIGSLKVKYNRVFGYFIEISSANLKAVPAHYQRKQTMVGGERFFTEELKKFEEEILTASSKQKALEAKLFEELLADLNAASEASKALSQAIGMLDFLINLSLLSQRSGWSFPEIDESHDFKLEASRHPVVESSLRGGFVPNDVVMDPAGSRTLLITGPNMGGKSTLMRQMAQIILLGQIGAPVPARSARWGVFHSLYTRIGAQDAIARGQSTFMVEMVELAHILNHADQRSFVVLDEIGRGTSTYDGMSVARAALEHLHGHSGARIVFATHYHELTDMEDLLPGLKNAYMKVLDEKGKLTFLYEMALGKSSKSFGIQVAELAGLPKAVVRKSWTILKDLESRREATPIPEAMAGDAEPVSQLSLFDPPSQTHDKLREELGKLDLDQMKPIDALQTLARLKEQHLNP